MASTANAADSIALFDGETLAGWHTNGERIGHGTGGQWTVEEGAIVGQQDPPGSGNGGILLTDAAYADFELSLELKPDWGIDSGLFIRSTEQGRCYQVLVDYKEGGNVGHIYGEGIGAFNNRTLDIFGLYDAEKNLIGLRAKSRNGQRPLAYTISPKGWISAWKINRWNAAKVRVVGNPPHIATWINGAKVSEFDAKTFDHPQYDPQQVAETLGEQGHIALQVHGGQGWPEGAKCRWRNIRILVLPGPPETGSPPDGGN
ncbi:MAG: DUF1080 domain-containing protein [Planctomycetales bacterium]|nr:DUF1080 domain-containing protein [Planctomycetales bacterium]